MAIVADRRVLDDRYRLDCWVATGTCCAVWRATDVVLGRQVAVKLLRGDLAANPRALSMFKAEVKHASSVTHENVARIYDFNDAVAGHPPFLVAEFVDGMSLADLLMDGPLGLRRTLDLIAQAAAGLDAAHRLGLVHHNLKPTNMLLAADEVVKLTDFGMARVARAGTGTGAERQACCTPAYLAPERAIGRAGTTSADLYALGVIAHECLYGEPPFAETPVEAAIAHVIRELAHMPAAIPLAVFAWVGQLTDKDPANRPRSAAEISERATALRRHMDVRDQGHDPSQRTFQSGHAVF